MIKEKGEEDEEEKKKELLREMDERGNKITTEEDQKVLYCK